MRPIILALAALAAQAACAAPQKSPAPSPAAQPVQDSPASAEIADVQFICADGSLVGASHNAAAGVLGLTRLGETRLFQQQVGRTPPRFVAGSETIVLTPDSLGYTRPQHPLMDCPRVPAAGTPGVVHATITKLDRMALPAGTRARVLLVDASRMDAPAIELGAARIASTGNQMPWHVLIRYDPARTRPPVAALLQARVEDADGRLRYITDSANPLPADDARQAPVELLVRGVPGSGR